MSIADRLAEIRSRVDGACALASRPTRDVKILAVSKLQPVEAIEEAYHLGLRDFGENYVQELVNKRRALAHLKGICWHLIGHLQTNKAKQAIQAADFFHALDSERLAVELGRRATVPLPVFLQVNLDGEKSKSGVSPTELGLIVEAVRAQKHLRLEGLMCIPEPKEPPEAMRPAFQELARLAKGLGLDKLSMGMSEDFEIAIEEGANWIRIGRKLFGERPKPIL